ncbi:glucose-6-phosphate isomerase family protein [Methanolobus chelungpuianus]|uniref:glucose-6-phosphate isomerase n=1 Tax=Methanolobus chelungpuianus TaxID=502115 RepID=A0AAE3HBK0_9EURY|nr:glucose-6-phosphate isomerase family protein [Methanolobus chelungpuianus]MCQ6963192.1 glucose-6-phosphate isomerase [Methanolobus chelungpuianus]
MGNELDFYGNIRSPDVRMLYDMDEVLFDREWLRSAENMELYYMYRNLYRSSSEHEIISKHNLSYDITVIPPRMLGREYVKTAGHYHPHVPGTELSYTEVYQVLEGKATYLLQKQEDDRITDVMVYNAEEGDCVLIPPGYGHITINATGEALKMANWVCRDFSSIYGTIRELSGGAYYLLVDGFVKNNHYQDVPPIRFMDVVDYPELGLVSGTDMYELVNDISRLGFLERPQDYAEVFERAVKGK